MTQPAREKVPLRTGRLRRIAGMARAGAGLALGTLARDPIAPLERAAETLAELRGLATKAGQMAGIWSAMLPPADRLRAEPILARLRAATQTSDSAAIRALVEHELGGPISELFAHFEDEPFASASLGQVHRATLHPRGGGTDVAVKVQHPGIEQALAADLDNAARIGGIAALLAVPTAGAMVDEVRARLEEELDYVAEARWQQRFTEIWKGDPVLSIPTVFPSHSRRRVLTSERITGLTVADARGGPHAGNQGRAIRRFLRESWLEHGLLFADPHAGNWIFHQDGRLTVLDFGSVLSFDADERGKFSTVLEAQARGHAPAARAAAASALGVTDDRASGASVQMMLLALAPLSDDRPIRSEDLASLAQLSMEAKKRMLGSRLKLPPWFPLVFRALIGTMALLVELEG